MNIRVVGTLCEGPASMKAVNIVKALFWAALLILGINLFFDAHNLRIQNVQLERKNAALETKLERYENLQNEEIERPSIDATSPESL
jgi:hypothetical protein